MLKVKGGYNMDLQPRDLIAIIVLLCAFTLLALKIDSIVGGLLIAVITYYFGMTHIEKRKSK
jgi:hypothetical protein